MVSQACRFRVSSAIRYLFWCILILSMVVGMEGVSMGQGWEADPVLVEQLMTKRKGFNYVESEVPQFELPDALLSLDGTEVRNAEMWQVRREELLEMFRTHVYGERPATRYAMNFEVVEEEGDAFEGKAIGRKVKAVVTIDSRVFEFAFVTFQPKKVARAVPVIVLINNRYFIPLSKALDEPDPFWPVESIIDHGYATAAFHTSDVDPDDKDGYAKGIRAFFANGAPPQDDDWRSLSAWGWAASRVLDYFQALPEVDSSQSAVVGHSRGGKTALWAACEDRRFAIAYSNNSGCGGAALSRRAYGETVGRITEVFPHWFCKNFAHYAGKENLLPVDQHEVMSLIAPRAIYVTSADRDLWADPRGEYLSLVAAAPVFKRLGASSIVEPTMPALDQPRIEGQTGYHIRSGGHNLSATDWTWFLQFTKHVFESN